MPTEVRIQPVEAFILFNEQESQVEKAVEMLEERRVSTYFWRRDIAIGESWSDIETVQLEEAKTVVVFLGAAGWGPTQQQIAESAVKLNKQIIPVLIGDPPSGSFEGVGGLFNRLRYLDMRQLSGDKVDRLAQEIRKRANTVRGLFDEARELDKDVRNSTQIERIIRVLIDGNEEERGWALRQVHASTQLDKRLLSVRLRREIQRRFSPEEEHKSEEASREPKRIRRFDLGC